MESNQAMGRSIPNQRARPGAGAAGLIAITSRYCC